MSDEPSQVHMDDVQYLNRREPLNELLREYGRQAQGAISGYGISAGNAALVSPREDTPCDYLLKQAEYYKAKAAQARQAMAQLAMEADRSDAQAEAFTTAAANLQVSG